MRLVLMLAVLLLSTPAWAVPLVEITSGLIRLDEMNDYDPRLRLFGEGLSIGDGFSFQVGFPHTCIIALCGAVPNPGNPLNMSVSGFFWLDVFRTYGGEFSILSHLDVVDDEVTTGPPFHWVVLTAPFTLTGSIGPLDAFSSVITAPDLEFFGQGTARWVVNGDFAQEAVYTITSTIPEPATWLLLLSGLGLLWLWRKAAHVPRGI